MDSLDPFRLNARTPPAPEAVPDEEAQTIDGPAAEHPLAAPARRAAAVGALAGAVLALVRFDWAAAAWRPGAVFAKDLLQQILLWSATCAFAAWLLGGVVAWIAMRTREGGGGASTPGPGDPPS